MTSSYTLPSARERAQDELRREREWLYPYGVKTPEPAVSLTSRLANLISIFTPKRVH